MIQSCKISSTDFIKVLNDLYRGALTTMANKFEKMNTEKMETGTDTGAAYDTLERGKNTYKAQPAANEKEQERRKADGKTQGRKNCKLSRINMAFSESNYDYIKTMSHATGQSMTDFVNQVIISYREEHSETYEKAKEFLQELSGE